MRLFAPNDVVAKSRFWYFVKMQRNVKKSTGQILACNVISEKSPTVLKNFAIWLRYTSRSGVHNMYKEFRDTSRVGAVRQLYKEMAGRHRARWSTIHIIRVDAIKSDDLRRKNMQQYINPKIKFPRTHIITRPSLRQYRKTFSAVKPKTHFG